MKQPRPPKDIVDLARRLEAAGYRAYLVGGAVRDSLLGLPSNDFDVATDAAPETVASLFRRVIPTGIRHGTVTVLMPVHSVEVTTFRTEHGYSDGRRPDRVEYAARIDDDLARRDFTVNSMAWDLLGRTLVDPFGGREDLASRTIKAVGDPMERFGEDGLRILRAIRFACQLDFRIEAETLKAIKPSLGKLESVSAERIRDEFSRIITSGRPSVGLRLMEETGILGMVVPELIPGRGMAQKGAHALDVLDHLYACADAAPRNLVLRLAALFHDAGKPESMRVGDDGIPTFHRHEEISGRIAETVLRRLRYPNDAVERVIHLVRQHMFNYEDRWTDSAVRRFIARAGLDSLEDILALRRADSFATAGHVPDPGALDDFSARIRDVVAKGEALGIGDLAVTGEDLASIGVPRGPRMGWILRQLLETVLDDPGQNEKSQLLGIASALLETSSGLGNYQRMQSGQP